MSGCATFNAPAAQHRCRTPAHPDLCGYPIHIRVKGFSVQPWGFGGGPDCDKMRELVVEREMSDSEIARDYGCSRQAVAKWRRKCGLDAPGRGSGPRRARGPRVSRKDILPWTIRSAHQNHPIRKRLVAVHKMRNGEQMAPDEEGRAVEFLDQLDRLDVVVDYDPDHKDSEGRAAPFFLVPRDPELDAEGDIVRRVSRPAGHR